MLRIALLLLVAILPTPGVWAEGIEGQWRIEAARDGGSVTITRTADGLVYERRSRATLSEPVSVERGVATFKDGWLSTAERVSHGVIHGLEREAEELTPWRGRYQLRVGGSLLGHRTGPGPNAVERLQRPKPNERFGNDVALFLDGAAFVDMRRHLRAATTSIDIQAYNWADDETGRSFAEILMEKARAGVRVRCLIETESRWVSRAIGERDVTHGMHRELEAAGAQVVVQNGIGDGALRYQRDLGTHDHCKLLVVDGRFAWVGGQNFATINETKWHGQQVRMEGPVARDAQRIFNEHWTRSGGAQQILPEAPGAPAAGDVPAELLLRRPGVFDAITTRHAEEIVKARRRILIATPQLHHDLIVQLLVAAAKRGVRVVVLVPEFDSDPQWLTREFILERQNELIEAGVEVYSYVAKPLDVKAATFDGRVSIMGSAPLNGTKMDETMLCVPDARFTREVDARIFRPALANSRRRGLIERGRLRRLKARLYKAFNRAL